MPRLPFLCERDADSAPTHSAPPVVSRKATPATLSDPGTHRGHTERPPPAQPLWRRGSIAPATLNEPATAGRPPSLNPLWCSCVVWWACHVYGACAAVGGRVSHVGAQHVSCEWCV
eukprot:1909980-Pyramimonas_sp.AAC.1